MYSSPRGGAVRPGDVDALSDCCASCVAQHRRGRGPAGAESSPATARAANALPQPLSVNANVAVPPLVVILVVAKARGCWRCGGWRGCGVCLPQLNAVRLSRLSSFTPLIPLRIHKLLAVRLSAPSPSHSAAAPRSHQRCLQISAIKEDRRGRGLFNYPPG